MEDGTEVHTNTIEGHWGNIKRKLKFMRGTSREKLPGYLDEYVFGSLIPRETLFWSTSYERLPTRILPESYSR